MSSATVRPRSFGRTRIGASGSNRLVAPSPCLPEACLRYWKGRTIYSPIGTMRGTVMRVRLCQHHRLCDGVNLEVRWCDELVSHICSYDIAVDAFDRHQLIE